MDDSGNFTNLSAVTVSGTLSAVNFTGSGAGLTGLSSGGAIDNSTVSAVTPSSGVATLSLTSARNFTVSTNANITSWSFTNVPAVARIKIILTNSGSPTTTVVWPTNIRWNRQIVPAWLNNYGANVVVTLLTTDTGTTWYGWIENDSKVTTRTRELYAVGYGPRGVWGDGNDRSSPTFVGTGEWDCSIAGHFAASGLLVGKADGSLWGGVIQPTIGWGTTSVVLTSSMVQIGGNGFNPRWDLSTTFGTWRIKKAAERGQSLVIIRQDGTLWGAGNNTDGVLGLNDTVVRSSFVQIGSASNWVQLYMGQGVNGGGSSMFVINTAGEMWACGTNASGCLGVGDTNNRSSLTLVAGGITWERFGYNHVFPGGYIYDAGYASCWTVAIAENGTMYSWGAGVTAAGNARGMTGQGDVVNRSTPVQLPGTEKWKCVSGNFISGTTTAIRADGTLWSWGANGTYYGYLGDGSTIARSSPIQIGTNKWKLVVGGMPSTHAIRDDGTLWGWGQGQQGQIGDGGAGDPQSMVQIGFGNQWVDIVVNSYVGGGFIRDPNL